MPLIVLPWGIEMECGIWHFYFHKCQDPHTAALMFSPNPCPRKVLSSQNPYHGATFLEWKCPVRIKSMSYIWKTLLWVSKIANYSYTLIIFIQILFSSPSLRNIQVYLELANFMHVFPNLLFPFFHMSSTRLSPLCRFCLLCLFRQLVRSRV